MPQYDISPAELEVLKVLWRQAPLPAQVIVDEVQKTQDWHAKTVKTLLNRLVKKEVLDFEKQGRSYLYQPTLSKSDYQRQQGKHFINRVFEGKLSPLVAGFANQGTLDQDDIDALKDIIAQYDAPTKGKNNDSN
ncbi:MAG: BlaI/MecI/CopY family transcriptional regulator [Firmicutes bacterium]|nr:BlaI/MecI/CopY family transcriptional regulator [Bacillota bacterium]